MQTFGKLGSQQPDYEDFSDQKSNCVAKCANANFTSFLFWRWDFSLYSAMDVVGSHAKDA